MSLQETTPPARGSSVALDASALSQVAAKVANTMAKQSSANTTNGLANALSAARLFAAAAATAQESNQLARVATKALEILALAQAITRPSDSLPILTTASAVSSSRAISPPVLISPIPIPPPIAISAIPLVLSSILLPALDAVSTFVASITSSSPPVTRRCMPSMRCSKWIVCMVRLVMPAQLPANTRPARLCHATSKSTNQRTLFIISRRSTRTSSACSSLGSAGQPMSCPLHLLCHPSQLLWTSL